VSPLSSAGPPPLDAPNQPIGGVGATVSLPTLDVLEALARGDIDVTEAERRLAAMQAGGPSGAEDHARG
jgi:hypothetical protein